MANSLTAARAEIGASIVRVARLWRREADQVLSAHGLSQATALPLLVLSRRGTCVRQGVLAEEMGIEGPSLVRLVDLLESEGLVERREDPTDRRAKMLHLTTLGETRAAEIDRVVNRVRLRLLKDVSPDELLLTLKVLRSIERQADEIQAGDDLEPETASGSRP